MRSRCPALIALLCLVLVLSLAGSALAGVRPGAQVGTQNGGVPISGLVTSNDEEPLVGVTVGLYQGGALVAWTTTGADGRYLFSDVAGGSYTVGPYSRVMTFHPGSRAVAAPPGATDADFVGSYFIAGTVRDDSSVPLAGVTVGLYQGEVLKVSAVTGANGRYYFLNLTPGAYAVEPALTGYEFTPASRVVTVPTGSSTADFVGSALPAEPNISGVLTTATGEPIPGVMVKLYQAGDGQVEQGSTITDAEGRYAFTVAPLYPRTPRPDDTYVVRPFSSIMTFHPGTRTVTVPPGADDADFVGGYFIAGTVQTAVGAGVPGVTVGLYQGGVLKVSAVTSANGRYYFLSLAPGSYTVQPASDGHVFSPDSRVVPVPPGSSAANFTASPRTATISGFIKTATGTPLFGVAVRLYQGADLKGSATTNAEGHYTFSGVPYGDYVVRPYSSTATFEPATRAVTVPPDATDINFVGGYVIAGTVRTAAGVGMPNVTVGLYQGEVLKVAALTSASGRYYFLNVAAGDYTVRPTETGTTFSPAARAVTVAPGNAEVNFVATAAAISGTVQTAEGVAVPNVPVALYYGGTPYTTTTTNADGRYYFPGLPGGSYTVEPSLAGHTFAPISRTLTIPSSDLNVNFIDGPL